MPLQEEVDGKLFPVSGRAADVLNALLRCAEQPASSCSPVDACSASSDPQTAFDSRPGGTCRAPQSSWRPVGNRCRKPAATAPGFGSRGALGHTVVPTTPALVPLVLDAAHKASIHRDCRACRTTRSWPSGWTGGFDEAGGSVAVDAFRNQRTGVAERVAPLSARRDRGAPRSADGQLLSGNDVRESQTWWTATRRHGRRRPC